MILLPHLIQKPIQLGEAYNLLVSHKLERHPNSQELLMDKQPKSMSTQSETITHGYISVNGLEMYYEIHGEGQPLVLLHGAFSAIGTSFGKVLPGLSKTRKVIAFELQAHGRTADIDRPLTIEGMADDVAAALEKL